MVKTENLEYRIFLDYCFNKQDFEKLKKEIRTEDGDIVQVYLGYRNPGHDDKFGLHVRVDVNTCGNAIVTYASMESIQKLMGAFNAKRIEDLLGREVTAYICRERLVGLSLLK